MNIALFDDAGYQRLLPLTWTRSCCALRCGRSSLLQKARRHIDGKTTGLWVRDALRKVAWASFPFEPATRGQEWCLLNSRALITADITPPPAGVAWVDGDALVAAGMRAAAIEKLSPDFFDDAVRVMDWLSAFEKQPPPQGVQLINYPWDLVAANAEELQRECTEGGTHAGVLYPGVQLVNPDAIHIAQGVRVKPGAVLDAEDGPIHIDADVLIEPNAVISGPCYIGPRSAIRPGATIREGTSIGPVCKIGGEVEGSIVHAYSNKQHDGFLGHSYLGMWVNLGADTITSDLKNTYGTIRVSLNGLPVETGQRFVGSTIGDHSKTGIGTILPTGCVIGVAANVFTSSSVPKFVPSFAWLTDTGLAEYRVDKAVEIARTVMARRKVNLSEEEAALLEGIARTAREIEAPGWQ